MTTSIPVPLFTDPAPAQRLERAAAALTAKNFAVEILDDAAVARTRIKDLIPEGASVFTGASETLRLSGIEEDINHSGRYDSLKSRPPLDRVTQRNEIWAALSTPDVIVGSVAAVTETGSLVVASASGSQLPGYAGAAARAIWVVGAQKVVPDLDTALRRVEDHCLPLESTRAMKVYGQPSAVNRSLSSTLNPNPGAAPSCCSARPSDSEAARSHPAEADPVRLPHAPSGRGGRTATM
jgi:L-lactate utilization protein LutC